MRRLSLLAPLLVAACLDIPPRAGADAPPGGDGGQADAPPACGPPADGVGVVDGQGCFVPIGSVEPAASIRVRAPGFVMTYANGGGGVPRYPSSLVVGTSPDLLFVNNGRDPTPADNPQSECQLENGLGQAFFPIGTAAFAPNDEDDVGPSSFEVFASGPVVAELSSEWTGESACVTAGGMASGGSTRLRYFPDGRIRRLDNLRVNVTIGACPTTACGFPNNVSNISVGTSYLALDRATFTHWTTPTLPLAALPAGSGQNLLGLDEIGCAHGSAAAVGIRSSSHPGRLNLFEGETFDRRSIALTTDLYRQVDYQGNPSLPVENGVSTLAIAGGGATCTQVQQLLATPPNVDRATWNPDDGWFWADLSATTTVTIAPLAALAPFAIELPVGDQAAPVPALVLTRGVAATPLEEGRDYLRQELVGDTYRSVLLWIKAGLAEAEPLTITRS